MPMTITDDATGEDKVVYTQEELDAIKAEEQTKFEAEFNGKLAEKDAYVQTKLDEFMKGRNKVEEKADEISEKEKQWQEQIEAANKTAQEAIEKITASEQARFNAIRDFIFEGYGGADPEIKKKLQEEWDILNLPITSEDDVKARATRAARNAGLASADGGSGYAGIPYGGGYAPAAKKKEGGSDAEYSQFKDVLGLKDILPDNKE